MAVDIKIPELGESLVEATIGRWIKSVGDHVEAGEPVVEIETDKVVMEVAAPESGVMRSVTKAEGDTATVGEVIATLDAAGEPAQPAGPAKTAPVAVSTAAVPPPPPPPPPPGEAAEGGEAGRRASPSVRRLARSLGVDLDAVPVTDPRGVVSREDVEAFAAQTQEPGVQASAAAGIAAAPGEAAAPPAPRGAAMAPAPPAVDAEPAPDEEQVRMSRRRLTIARQLVTAQQTAAMLTTFNEVDMSAILALRAERKERFREEHGVSLGFMSFFVTATVGALKRFERLNAEIRGDEMILKRHYDIGIAVATDEGLVVPVLRAADRLTFSEIEQRIADLAAHARAGTLSLDDLRGGTFTITNGGVFGSLFSTPILNPPQVAILGMHAVAPRPVAIGDKVEVRPMMYVALSYDHRIVDGSEAVRFLVTVKRLVEDPMSLLLEA